MYGSHSKVCGSKTKFEDKIQKSPPKFELMINTTKTFRNIQFASQVQIVLGAKYIYGVKCCLYLGDKFDIFENS